MPATLVLSPRYSDDSIKLRRAAIAAGWDVTRLASWRVPADFEPEEPVPFAEPLFNDAVAEQLDLRAERSARPPRRRVDRRLGRGRGDADAR